MLIFNLDASMHAHILFGGVTARPASLFHAALPPAHEPYQSWLERVEEWRQCRVDAAHIDPIRSNEPGRIVNGIIEVSARRQASMIQSRELRCYFGKLGLGTKCEADRSLETYQVS